MEQRQEWETAPGQFHKLSPTSQTQSLAHSDPDALGPMQAVVASSPFIQAIVLVGCLELCRLSAPSRTRRFLASALATAMWILVVDAFDPLVYQVGEVALLTCMLLLPDAEQRPAAAKPSAGALVPAELAGHKESAVLTPEELAAIQACKRIIAKAREKFLNANNGFVPMASQQVQDFCAKAYDMFVLNLRPDLSSENQPWALTASDDEREIRIYTAKFKGSTQRWKVVATLEGDMEKAYDAIFDPAVRRTWDPMVKAIDMLQINDCAPSVGDGLALSSIVTASAAGGLVKSRSLLDLALQRTHPKGGIHIANGSCPESFPEYKLGAAPGSDGMIRAITHLGSGCSLMPIPGRPGFLACVLRQNGGGGAACGLTHVHAHTGMCWSPRLT
jgi:hypothetical protein